jgi:hypothetical protein
LNKRKREQNERIKRKQLRFANHLLVFNRQVPSMVERVDQACRCLRRMAAAAQQLSCALAALQPPGNMVIERAMSGDVLSTAEARRLTYFHDAWERMLGRQGYAKLSLITSPAEG